MADKSDFTAQEWIVMHRAVIGAAMLGALSEGGTFTEATEMAAVNAELRANHSSTENHLVRALSDGGGLEASFDPSLTLEDARGPAVDALRAAASIVAWTSPRDATPFKAFLVGVAEAAAKASKVPTPEGSTKLRAARAAAELRRVRNALGAA